MAMVTVLATLGITSGPASAESPKVISAASPPVATTGTASPEVTTPTGTLQAFFSTPTVNSFDDSIERRILDLINAADATSQIRVSIYSIESEAVAKALITAQRDRRVDVRVLGERCHTVDKKWVCSPADADLLQVQKTLTAELGADHTTWCLKGCMRSNSENHDKFWLFSAVTLPGNPPVHRTNVVAQSSHNMNADSYALHNDLLVSTGDRAIYDAYLGAWNKMWQIEAAGGLASWNDTNGGHAAGHGGAVESWFYPRASTQDDVLAARIREVPCASGGRIRIAMASWRNERPLVKEALTTKAQSGCRIEAVISAGAEAGAEFLPPLGVPVYVLPDAACDRDPQAPMMDGTAGRRCSNYLHSKYVLLEWTGAGGVPERHVYTGSTNLYDAILTSTDESSLHIANQVIYDAYAADWQTLRDSTVKFLPGRFPDAALTAGVNSVSGGDQRAPAAAARNGWTAVVWESQDTLAAGNPTHVWLRLFKDGVSRFETRVSMDTTSPDGSHLDPDVDVDANGNTVVVWTEDADGNGQGNIAVRRYGPTGQLQGTRWANDEDYSGAQIEAAVATRDDGSFVVAWQNDPAGTTGVRLREFDSLMQTQQPSWRRLGSVTGSNGTPDLAVDPTGNVFAVWKEDADANGSFNIAGGKYSRTGTVLAAPRTLNALDVRQQERPTVAVDAQGRPVVAWQGDASGMWQISVRGFDASLGQRFPERTVDSPPNPDSTVLQGWPALAVADDGSFLVAWNDVRTGAYGTDVFARGFNVDGTTTGRLPDVRLSPLAFNDQNRPSLGMRPDGTFDLFYADDFDGNRYHEIYRLSGLKNTDMAP
ncbi:phospholipase D-like domain-containing protein [Streptomyces roseolus]|uniref:phospholipase D-like domain-containing protein n=1 Tax=Streptomyces roseolus TaxID=67358 RepID=UPI0036F0584C